MRTMKVVVLGAVLALTLSACAGAEGDGVAALDEGAAAAASASPSVSNEEALQAFAECLRENGVPDYEDPQVDDEGRIMFGGGPGGEGGPTSEEDRAVLRAAMEACGDLLPEGVSVGPGESVEDQAAFQDAVLEYARCMREQGIDVPDPDFSDLMGFMSSLDESDPDFQAADEICRPALREVLAGAPGS